MNGVTLVTRWGLAAVFMVSGVAKLVDRAGTRRSLVDFGAPAVVVPAVASLLPIAELVSAVALLVDRTAWWGALGVVVLLVVFTAAIAISLLRGRTPDCHCFGQLRSAPIGANTLVRNAVLTAMAVLVLWSGPGEASPTAGAMLTPVDGAVWRVLALANGAVALLLLVALVHLLRQNGRILLRLDAVEARLGDADAATAEPSGLPVGEVAPGFSLPDLDGVTVALETMAEAGKRVVLFFGEPACSACDEVLPDVARWQRVWADRVSTLVISRGTVGQNRNKRAKYELGTVLLQRDREIAEAYGVVGTPSAVIVADGKIASRLAAGPDAIRSLVDDATRVVRGQRPPAIRLPDLKGTLIDLSRPTGRPQVLLFWSPNCGYCQELLPAVKQWEHVATEDDPTLLVISTGSPEANAAQGFTSEVLIDRQFEAGTAFGASGTPSAVALDAHGRVTSNVRSGAEGVGTLLRFARG
jgi:peroxiredoxin/uncharacterized membrane protein YphA (DoxX/SURF4 family)